MKYEARKHDVLMGICGTLVDDDWYLNDLKSEARGGSMILAT